MFAAFPIVFQQKRGWSEGIGGLAFIGIAVGMLSAVIYTIPDNGRYNRVAELHDGRAPPEARLPPGIIGCFFLPIGLFWFAVRNVTLNANRKLILNSGRILHRFIGQFVLLAQRRSGLAWSLCF